MGIVKTIFVTAKCSDLCHVDFRDANGNSLGERDGYVPDWMPEEHYGDYVELEIEVATGKILNWKEPKQKDLKDSME